MHMGLVRNHELLFSTDIKYFKALQVIEGRNIFDRYKLASTIFQEVDDKFRYFIAYPIKENNHIEFHGIKSHNEKPEILSDLVGEKRSKYEVIKDKTLDYYKSLIEEFSFKDTNKANFICDAIKSIDDRFIYCYDDRVVLGAWGMQLRDNVREDITVIRRSAQRKTKPEAVVENISHEKVDSSTKQFTVSFNVGDSGSLVGEKSLIKNANSVIQSEEIPNVIPHDGYEFVGWDAEPAGFEPLSDTNFTAQYRQIPSPSTPVPPQPWWRRLWSWLVALFTSRGCLKWIIWTLFLLLLFFLMNWLFEHCKSSVTGGGALGDNDSTWIRDDSSSRVRGGGIYDPYNPYEPKPTPSPYLDILPPKQGVLPPMEENPQVDPSNPSVLANRLNILMENEDKSIYDFAKDFNEKYPKEKYKILYYDDVIKRIQVEIPSQERERLKTEIPQVFSPKYQLFIFDESLFESFYMPNDPAILEQDKSWHLRSINAYKAWDISRGSEDVTIAIVDNGFNLSHPEFQGKVVAPYNVWSHSNAVFSQSVDHGTHVAGIALANADNALGLCGIAPKCRFMPVQVGNVRNLKTTTSVLDGIIYALYQGADVINVSLGLPLERLANIPESEQRNIINTRFKEEERLWREIMKIAAKHNSTIVIAAGNDSMLAGVDPFQRPELFICVSAVDKVNNGYGRANFSNYGQFSDISAPGVNIYSTVGRNAYTKMQGTSMSAPIVSGTVALMKSINKSLTSKQILCILQNTGLLVNGGIGKMIQLDKALEQVRASVAVDCTPAPLSGDVQVLLKWSNYNDLDLIVTDPNGEEISFSNTRSKSGGQLQIDKNVEYPDSKTPIENIFWPQNSAPFGTYNVYLSYFNQHESFSESPFSVTVKYGNQTKEFNATIKSERDVIPIYTFTYSSLSSDNRSNENNSISSVKNQSLVSSLVHERGRLQREIDRVNRELKRLQNRN